MHNAFIITSTLIFILFALVWSGSTLINIFIRFLFIILSLWGVMLSWVILGGKI